MTLIHSLRISLLAILLFVTSSAYAQGQPSEAKTKDIQVLLELMEVGPTMQNVLVKQIEKEQAQGLEGIPANFWEEFKKEAMSSLPELINAMVPLYDRSFTHDEIKKLIQIHKDPVMIKFSKLGGELAQEATDIGEAWGEAIGKRVVERLLGEPDANELDRKEG